jgi:hypothetical protein
MIAAPDLRRYATRFRMSRLDWTLDSLPAPVVGGGR